MSLIHQVVAAIQAWDASHAEDRAACIDHLTALRDNLATAVAIWQAQIDSGEVRSDLRAVTTWIDPQRAKQLNDLHYPHKNTARALGERCGVALVDAFDICEELAIERGYRKLATGETVGDAIDTAHRIQAQRLAAVEAALARLTANG